MLLPQTTCFALSLLFLLKYLLDYVKILSLRDHNSELNITPSNVIIRIFIIVL